MVKKTIILFILFTTAYAKAQKISGTITNLEDKLLTFSWTSDFLISKTDSVVVDQNGKFNINIPFKKAGYLTIRNSIFLMDDVYIWPGATLNLIADGKSSSTFYNSRKYIGSAEKINNFLASIQTSPALKKHGFGSKTYKLPEEKFIAAITAYFEVRDSLKHSYFMPQNIENNNHILKDFLFTDSINMLYFKSATWFSYLNHLKNEDKEKFFSTYIQPLAKQNDDYRLLSAAQYRFFWNNLISYKLQLIRNSLPPEKSSTAEVYYQNIPNLITNNLKGKIKQSIASNYIQNMVYAYKDMHDSDEIKTAKIAIAKLYELLNNKEAESHYRKLFKEETEFRQLIEKDEIAKDFNVIDTNGKSYSLKDFQGKIIYIDLWASWCSPCIAEIPDTKNMLAAIKSAEKLAYLSISLDDQRKDWINGLRNHNPPGLQLWSMDGFKSSLAKTYKITAIPHYILINEHGKLINYAAPRPSSGVEIINLINSSINNIKE